MSDPAPDVALVERPARALLDLIAGERDRRIAAVRADAGARGDALRASARTLARARVTEALAELRLRRADRVAAAEARLATRRRLHEQQRQATLLREAWLRLPAELVALWQDPAVRVAWVARVRAAALERLPAGPWQVVHAGRWTSASTEWGPMHDPGDRLEADASITAGLKIVAGCNVVDGTSAGIVADRAEVESRLLRALEAKS
jgi:hypothetical protein